MKTERFFMGGEKGQLDLEQLDVAEERSIYIKQPSGKFLKAKDHKAVWNLNQNALGCIASSEYNIIQHRHVVKSLIEALNNLNVQFTHKLQTDGNRIFLDIEFPSAKIYVQKGEEFVAGIRLVNSYNKTTGLLILPRLVRLVCTNGMVMHQGFLQAYTIRHTQKLAEDFQGIVEKSIKSMIDGSVHLKAMINDCISDSIEWKLAEKVYANLLHRKKHIEEIFKRLEHKDQVTRWDLYNAITDYATHGEQLKPTIETWLQRKAERLLTTPLENYMQEGIPLAVVQEA